MASKVNWLSMHGAEWSLSDGSAGARMLWLAALAARGAACADLLAARETSAAAAVAASAQPPQHCFSPRNPRRFDIIDIG